MMVYGVTGTTESIVRPLSSRDLQSVIRAVDSAVDREKSLQQLIASNADFADFVRTLCDVTNPDAQADGHIDPHSS